MAEDVRLNIVLEDDGVPAGRPAPPAQAAAPAERPRAKLEGEDDGRAAAMAAKGIGGEEGGEAEAGKGAAGGVLGALAGAASAAASALRETLSRGAALAAASLSLAEGGAKRAAAALEPLARNDMMGALKASASSAAEALSLAGKAGEAASVALTSVVGIIDSFATTVQAFIDRGKQLAQYSPALAGSEARAELASTMADMREASELGDGISRMTDAQTELMTMLRDTLLPVKRFVVEVLAAAMETLVQASKDGYIVLSDIWHVAEKLPEYLTAAADYMLSAGTRTDLFESINDTVRSEGRATRRMMESKKDDDPIQAMVDKMMADIAARVNAPLNRADPVLAGGMR